MNESLPLTEGVPVVCCIILLRSSVCAQKETPRRFEPGRLIFLSKGGELTSASLDKR